MLHATTQTLILKLAELTGRGEVAWREGAEGALVFETEGYVVELVEAPPRLRLLQDGGKELERADEALLASASHDNSSFAERIAAMAEQARRHARGTDQAISRILTSLSTSAPDPGPAFSTKGGANSEAAMAAAVASMASRVKAAAVAPATLLRPGASHAPSPVAEPALAPAAPSPIQDVSASEAGARLMALTRTAGLASPVRTVASEAMFGAIRSFKRSPPPPPPAPPTPPAPQAPLVQTVQRVKVTAAGLVVPHTTAPSTADGASASADSERAKPAASNHSANGYRPWS